MIKYSYFPYTSTLWVVIVTLFYCLVDLSCGECSVISQYAWVWLLFCCRMLWMCLVWSEVLCWIDYVWPSKECTCCACDPSVHLSVPSIGVVYVFVCRKLSPHLRVWELDHRWFISFVVSLCDFAYYVVGQEPAVAVHLTLWYIVFISH